jgi:hypothetical protein
MRFTLILLVLCLCLVGFIEGFGAGLGQHDKPKDDEMKKGKSTTTRSPIESDSDESNDGPQEKGSKA